MGVVKPNRDGIDAFEHAMQGVHTSNDHKIVKVTHERGLIGASSTTQVSVANDSAEREVIVKLRRPRSRRRR